MPRMVSTRKPKNLLYTVKRLLAYMGRHRISLLAVAVMVIISVFCNLMGTYMINPVINGLVDGSGMESLIEGVSFTAAIYIIGVLAALGYSQIMAVSSQKIVYDIRKDLFSHMQTLPLSFFDSHQHGDVMSYYTNDVDTISDALNNSFAAVIKNGFQITGTMLMLLILNWKLSMIVAISYTVMFLYVRYSARHSKKYYRKHQESLGILDGYIQEMVAGQKVIKVFNHEEENLKGFMKRNEELQAMGTAAQSYASTMIPAVVSLSFLTYTIVSLVGGFMAMSGLTTIGALASYLVFVRQAAAPINQFTQQSNFLLSSLAGAERIFELIDRKSETDEGTVTLLKKPDGWAWKAGDKVYLGSSDPLYRGNFSTMAMWKGFTLNVSFGYYWGGKTYNQTLIDRVEVTTNQLTTSNVDRRVYTDRWMKPGDVTFFKGFSNETTQATSRFVMDDNVLELQSVSLQYRWDSEWIRRHAGVQSITFGLNMSDLFHWGSINMERGTSYPYARNIQGSVKFLF